VGRNGFDSSAALADHPAVEAVLSHDANPASDTYRVRTAEALNSVTTLTGSGSLAGAQIRSINLVRPTLGDVFVSLTGSTITETGDAESL
jgi:hypothetical protein